MFGFTRIGDDYWHDCDWYDFDRVEKLNRLHSTQSLKLYKKLMDAEKKGNAVAVSKAREALRKHEELGRAYKEKANKTGFYWC